MDLPQHMVDMVEQGGNTTPPATAPYKRVSASKSWCFTLNNWTDAHLVEMCEMFERYGLEYVIGEEGRDEGKTPHLQGAIFGDRCFRPMERFNLTSRPHWEKCKGSKEQNIRYCVKEGGRIHTNIQMVEPIRVPEMWGWQLEPISLLSEEPKPDCRKILWYWEPDGNVGKSELMRYLVMKMGAVVCAGKAADMKCLIAKHTEKNKGVAPKIVVFDVPRDYQEYLNYAGIEEIKNGIFASPKYESMMHIQNRPHVLVLANFAPVPGERMSADRFHVVRIGGEAEERAEMEHQGQVWVGGAIGGGEWQDM